MYCVWSDEWWLCVAQGLGTQEGPDKAVTTVLQMWYRVNPNYLRK